jgi:hypothetical protein
MEKEDCDVDTLFNDSSDTQSSVVRYIYEKKIMPADPGGTPNNITVTLSKNEFDVLSSFIETHAYD